MNESLVTLQDRVISSPDVLYTSCKELLVLIQTPVDSQLPNPVQVEVEGKLWPWQLYMSGQEFGFRPVIQRIELWPT